MRKFFFRPGAAAAVLALTATTLVGGFASPAQAELARADISPSSVTVFTTAVVLDGDAGCANRSRVRVELWDPQAGQRPYQVTATIHGPGGSEALPLKPESLGSEWLTYSGDVFLCGSHAPGNYTVRVAAKYSDVEGEPGPAAQMSDSFTVRRPASLTYNAAPEPVKKGKKLTHSGVLKLDPVARGPKFGAKGVTLKIYFKANGAKAYAYKGSVKTGKGGKFSKKLTATKSGTWQIVYAGDAYRQKVVKTDAVKVKG